MTQSFHVYPSAAQLVDPPPNVYSRSVPLACDTVEFNSIDPTVGYFDTTNHCYVALVPQIVRFYVNILWSQPPEGSGPTVWFFKNTLPPPDGSSTGEIAGEDRVAHQPSWMPTGGMNQSNQVGRAVYMLPNDRVWAVPGCPNNSGGIWLTGAVSSNGNNTCNYFEGEVLEVNPILR